MVLYLDLPSALGGTRIPNLLIRSQMLCPIELRAQSELALYLQGPARVDAQTANHA